ncbi:hypothetical protein KY495_07080 [Massilia sp. PAMC28688]|uniref:hypothetical protein n=1 Tax=Massilia sp. PAMC28688 TaxID=2861283 RepID=UPI001C636768|nr:hypothetical protein [Massilia sp. PAMC28688]QYF94930.1 hypothetical protein KY495_07080 [Massilia sp. PAMC28688]
MLLRGAAAYFVDEFVRRGGLDPKTARSILSHLTFKKTSKDLLDAPFVSIGGELILMPSVAFLIEPAFSIESLLKSIQKHDINHELAFIGDGFEKIIKKDLSGAKLIARKVKHRSYECDVAFVLDSVLFLCECKGRLVPSEFWSYAKLEHYLTHDAVEQHTRTCDYFAEHLQYVRGSLKLPPDWHPKEIRRIIVTSAKLGRAITKNGIIIVDENTFHAFFSRMHLTTRDQDGAIVDKSIDSRLVGELTAENFIDFISVPRSIVLHEGFLAHREVTLHSLADRVVIRDVECYGEVKLSTTASET